MKIKSIKKIDYKDDVYNLHIKDNHNYYLFVLIYSL
jgi:intein/homing endonuclease